MLDSDSSLVLRFLRCAGTSTLTVMSALGDRNGVNASTRRPCTYPNVSSSSSSVGNLALLDGVTIAEEHTELPQENLHLRRPDAEHTLICEEDSPDADEDDHAIRAKLPWWKRPSPQWSVLFYSA